MHFDFPPLTRVIRAVLIGQAVVFVAFAALSYADVALGSRLVDWMGLHASTLLRGHVWTLLTYPWLHYLTGYASLILDCLALYLIGSSVERSFGAKPTARLVLQSSIFAGFGVVLADLVSGLVAGHGSAVPFVGPAGVINALIGALCFMHWDRWLNVLVVRFRGSHLLALSLFLGLLPAVQGNLAGTAAAWSGVAFGYAFAAGWTSPRTALDRLRLLRARRRLKVVRGPEGKQDWLN